MPGPNYCQLDERTCANCSRSFRFQQPRVGGDGMVTRIVCCGPWPDETPRPPCGDAGKSGESFHCSPTGGGPVHRTPEEITAMKNTWEQWAKPRYVGWDACCDSFQLRSR